MDVLNSPSRVNPWLLEVTGTVLVSTGTPSLSQLSGFPESDQLQVTIADNGTGDFSISVKNFRGQNSYLAGFGTGTTISTMVGCVSQSFTAGTDTAVFQFKVEDDASTASDTGFNFILRAF